MMAGPVCGLGWGPMLRSSPTTREVIDDLPTDAVKQGTTERTEHHDQPDTTGTVVIDPATAGPHQQADEKAHHQGDSGAPLRIADHFCDLFAARRCHRARI